MKAKRIYKRTTTHGGVVPAYKKMKELGIAKVIEECLGRRKAPAQYQYSDMFINWALAQMCGATRLEQIQQKRKHLQILPKKIPNHDTVARLMKCLAEENTTIQVDRPRHKDGGRYLINENLRLNEMLIRTTKCIGALNKNQSYTLDIDAMFISTTRKEAAEHIKQARNPNYAQVGFNPMICLIGDLPVFISMRFGDANARVRLYECLSNCLDLLKTSEIKVGRVISDAAGYHRETLEMLDAKGILFNMRFTHGRNMHNFTPLLQLQTWRETTIRTANYTWYCQTASISHKMIKGSKPWRVVALRIPTEEYAERIHEKHELERIREAIKKFRHMRVQKGGKQSYVDGKWVKIGTYLYKFIVTNDWDKSEEDLVIEYNKRGNAERKFSFMKDDFGWRMPPFFKMKENMVFMIATAFSNNMFRGLVRFFIDHAPGLRITHRLKKFIENFIMVACELVNGTYVFYNTDTAYEKIME